MDDASPEFFGACAPLPIPAHRFELFVIDIGDAVMGGVAVTENGDQIDVCVMPGFGYLEPSAVATCFLSDLRGSSPPVMQQMNCSCTRGRAYSKPRPGTCTPEYDVLWLCNAASHHFFPFV
jgi:hypothetical protein